MKKLLPVRLPEITCHLGMAALMGILTSLNIGNEWIYTNFIMTEAFVLQDKQYEKHLDFVIIPAYESAIVCPYVLRSEVQGSFLADLKKEEIVDILKRALDLENYIYITVDEDKFFHKGHVFFMNFLFMDMMMNMSYSM